MFTWQMENLGAWTDPVTEDRTSSGSFRSGWDSTRRLLAQEIGHLGADWAVLQVVVVDGFIRQDGMLSSRAKVGHPGVVVSFDSDLGPLRYACDQYEQRWSGDLPSWQANVRAIALGLGALRAVDRYGIAGRREQYVGWKALPAGRGDTATGMTATDAAEVLVRISGDLRDPTRETFTHWGALIVRRAQVTSHPDLNHGDRGQWNLVDNAVQTLQRAGWLPRELQP